MEYYAYIPKEDGLEPLGTENRLIMKNLKTQNGAIRKARRILGNSCKVFSYTNFYNDKTFKQVK